MTFLVEKVSKDSISRTSNDTTILTLAVVRKNFSFPVLVTRAPELTMKFAEVLSAKIYRDSIDMGCLMNGVTF